MSWVFSVNSMIAMSTPSDCALLAVAGMISQTANATSNIINGCLISINGCLILDLLQRLARTKSINQYYGSRISQPYRFVYDSGHTIDVTDVTFLQPGAVEVELLGGGGVPAGRRMKPDPEHASGKFRV